MRSGARRSKKGGAPDRARDATEEPSIRTLTLSTLGALAGLALAIFILERCGLGAVFGLLARARLGIALVIGLHLVQLAFSASAWRAVASSGERRPGLLAYGAIRWIREGVNGLLPVAQIGGEVVAARLLGRLGVALPRAIAGLVCDVSIELLTQIGFVLLGLALLLWTTGTVPPGHAVIAGVGVAVALAGSFLAAQWFGAARLTEQKLLRMARRFGWSAATEVAGLDAAIRASWRRPGALSRATAWHSISWLLGGLEVWVALRMLGTDPPSLAGCTAIESLGLGLKAAGFFVPGALGVQEGGFVLICSIYGIPADTGIALSLVKRVREVVLGAPSLLAWQIGEGRGRRGRPVLDAPASR